MVHMNIQLNLLELLTTIDFKIQREDYTRFQLKNSLISNYIIRNKTRTLHLPLTAISKIFYKIKNKVRGESKLYLCRYISQEIIV